MRGRTGCGSRHRGSIGGLPASSPHSIWSSRPTCSTSAPASPRCCPYSPALRRRPGSPTPAALRPGPSSSRRGAGGRSRRACAASSGSTGSGSRRHREQVLLLEPRAVGRAEVPLVAEPVERLDELLLPPVVAGVLQRRDGRAVLLLEVRGVVLRMLEGGHL